MNYDLVRHFSNEIEEDKLKMVEVLKRSLNSSIGPISMKIGITMYAKTTVVGTVVETEAGKILQFGVARCASNDTFYKKQGREFAKWRALNYPVLRVQLHETSEIDEIQGLFFVISAVLNRKFKFLDQVHALARIPDFLKTSFGTKIPVKQKWTEEQIAEAKSKAELAMQGLHERLAGIQP